MSTNKKNGSGCLSFFFPWLRKNENGFKEEILESDHKLESFPYSISDRFLSPAEHSFYLVTQQILQDKYMIAPKVSLAEIFFVTDQKNNYAFLNKIIRKRIDFLVCDAVTMKPQFAIELDDSSHNIESRVERDEFVNKVFLAAKMPLVRVSAKKSYITSDLQALFTEALFFSPNKGIEISESVGQQNATTSNMVTLNPVCPKCGAEMVVRVARYGSQTGNKFYGCSNYPNCRTTIPIFED